MNDIPWGTVHCDDEVLEWIDELSNKDFGRVWFYLDLLAQEGPLLREPHTKQLGDKLRELRFHLGTMPMRLTYWIAPDRRIIMLTVFSKTKRREAAQVMRARRALWRCRQTHNH